MALRRDSPGARNALERHGVAVQGGGHSRPPSRPRGLPPPAGRRGLEGALGPRIRLESAAQALATGQPPEGHAKVGGVEGVDEGIDRRIYPACNARERCFCIKRPPSVILLIALTFIARLHRQLRRLHILVTVRLYWPAFEADFIQEQSLSLYASWDWALSRYSLQQFYRICRFLIYIFQLICAPF
jgi:hypothetical protein